MSLLQALLGRKKVLSFEILFNSTGEVGVSVKPHVLSVPGPEYVRLWASYEAKMLYNL